MDYEARMDARNDYNAEIANEARNKFESELPGIIEGAIEAGEYDKAVCLRATKICEKKNMLEIASTFSNWAEETSG